MRRSTFGLATAALVVVGVLFRLGPWHLPLWAHHDGGGALWGAMIFCGVAALRPSTWTTRRCLLTSLLVISTVELSRRFHTAGLDRFRLTLLGQLLLGRIYAPINIVTDAVGALVAAMAALRLRLRLAPAAPICEERA